MDFNLPPVPQTVGFSTGHGKKIETKTTDLMAKGQLFFKDLDFDDEISLNGFKKAGSMGLPAPAPNNVGFSTGHGKKIDSKTTDLMAKGQLLFKDLDFDDDFDQNAPKTAGFSTGHGKKIDTKTTDLMAKGQLLFKDLDFDDDFDLNAPQTVGFSSGHRKKIDTISRAVDTSDTTPKLPTNSKFPVGRRRLADASSSPVATSSKKKRLGITRIIDAMDEQPQPKPNRSLKLFSPSLPSLLSPSPVVYNRQNGTKTRSSAAAASGIASVLFVDDMEDDRSLSVDTSIVISQPRKVEVGKLYVLRRNATERASLASMLAGQAPRIYDLEEYERYGVKQSTLEVSIQNAGTFAFTKDYLPKDLIVIDGDRQLVLGDGVKVTCDENGSLSSDEFISGFMNSLLVDPKLISMEWCANHYRWIVWKEASMEAGFPHLLGGKLLTPDRIMLQLKYRYDREMEKAERPCLKRILNMDDSTYRPTVLCISAILVKQECDALIEVTDGWYSLKARLDSPLSHRLTRGQLLVGQKLFISRCTLIGLEGGCEPLEVPASAQLVLTANCVRRARWNAKLGFQRLKKIPSFSLSSLSIGGGMVVGVEVLIQRIQPMLYMVKNSNGHTLIMDEKAERKDARVFEDHYERCLEKIVEEIEKSLIAQTGNNDKTDATAIDGSRLVPRTQEIRSVGDIEELYRIISKAADPEAVADRATVSQKALLKSFCAKISEQQAFAFHDRFEKAVREKTSMLPQRRVTPFLKMRVIGCHSKDAGKNVAPLLTIWRPDDDALYHVKEGMTCMVTSLQVTPSNTPGDTCKFSLSTTAETRFVQIQKKQMVMTVCKNK